MTAPVRARDLADGSRTGGHGTAPSLRRPPDTLDGRRLDQHGDVGRQHGEGCRLPQWTDIGHGLWAGAPWLEPAEQGKGSPAQVSGFSSPRRSLSSPRRGFFFPRHGFAARRRASQDRRPGPARQLRVWPHGTTVFGAHAGRRGVQAAGLASQGGGFRHRSTLLKKRGTACALGSAVIVTSVKPLSDSVQCVTEQPGMQAT